MSKHNFATASHDGIDVAISAIANNELNEAVVDQYIRPLFSRSLGASTKIYLANHSLGRMLDQTEKDVIEGLQYWYDEAQAWEHWLAEMQCFCQQTANLIHAEYADSIIPKISAGQGLRAVLNCYDKSIKVISSADEFNSIDFILKVFAQRQRIQLERIKPQWSYEYQIDDFVSALRDKPTLIVLSMVYFTTGQLLQNLDQLIAAAHEQHCLVLLDLYHVAGVIPIDVSALDVDFAIGGSYKYLRGGPGAGWLYIHPRHHDGSLRTLDTGWFAQEQVFAYERAITPKYAEGGKAFLESTPAILPFYQARAGLKFTLGVGVQRLRQYALQQQSFIEELLQWHDIPYLGTTGNRGAFIAIPHAHAEAMITQLELAGVICDSRGSLLRLCPDILNTEQELSKAINKLSKIWVTL